MDRDNEISHSIIGQFAKHGVELNDLIIPGRMIESHLGRFCLNLVANNDHEAFKVLLLGSATPIFYQGRYVLLTSQHQLKGIDPRQVAMLTDSGSHIITSGGFRAYNPSPETDAYDIVAFDFTEVCADRPEFKQRFFNLKNCPPDATKKEIVAILLSGYPFDVQNYDLLENNHLGLTRRNVVCQPEAQPTDECLLTVRPIRPYAGSPNGMSGGSAFVIQMHGVRAQAYFAGLILRGGTNYFHIIKAGFVMAFLNRAFGPAS